MLPVNTVPHGTVVAGKAVIVGNAAGLTVMFLDTDAIVLPHTSVAVHVSTTTPPHAPAGDCGEKVEVLEVPFNAQPPVKPLL